MSNHCILLDNIICHDNSIYIYIRFVDKILFDSFNEKKTHFFLGVASNLERKSRENARKMSSLVGMLYFFFKAIVY